MIHRALVLESKLQQQDQDIIHSQVSDMQQRLDAMQKEIHRLHLLVDYEFMSLRVCIGPTF